MRTFAAAALALAAAWAAALFLEERSRCQLLEQQLRLGELERRSLQDQLEAERLIEAAELRAARQAAVQHPVAAPGGGPP